MEKEQKAKEKLRNASFVRRVKGLKKKIYEITTLCGLDACMVLYPSTQGDRTIQCETWPNDSSEVHQIIQRYHNVDKRGKKRSLDLSDFEDQKKKKKKMEDDKINDFSADQLGKLVGMLGSQIELMDGKIQLMKNGKKSISSDGRITEMGECSHTTTIATENQRSPCYDNVSNSSLTYDDGTTSWSEDTMHMQSLCHVTPMDHPSMIFHNSSSMISMNGFGCGDFSNCGTIENFSYDYERSFINDQAVPSMAFGNQGPFACGLQPSIVDPILPITQI